MANVSSRATVSISVNGTEAQKKLKDLTEHAEKLRKKIDTIARSGGDPKQLKKMQRELQRTEKQIDRMRDQSKMVERVLHNINKASMQDLNKALRQLQTQLNKCERGTKAWADTNKKVQRLKQEINSVNRAMSVQKSTWSKFNSWLNNTQTALMGVVAALAGLISAGRRAVKAYATMEEQMANTRKYTRMTKKEVDELNDAFKKMNTRIAREELNLLAQEGGRLGYNTVQTVKEYTEAASIIKVALVDLGEGATQTIAKISNIFGIEQLYGVREGMLKVGSTVNHLSQNCTASKPYIVEFAKRLAGVGATAKMSIPEIMAFAATLDANGQKVEMSATAIQRVIMSLYKAPRDMARKVGLDVNKFTQTLQHSTTDGVMMFLEALKKLGETNALAVLSPLFQDLGLDGVRVSSVLANLSNHLDMLKWQMGEANKAFNEGKSASNEYAIFNNTVQAQIDKAKARVHELAVELGEKLYPVMKHIYTSSSFFLRVLNQIVTFVIDNRKAIISLTSVLVTYYSAAFAAKAITFALTKVLTAWRAVVAICKTNSLAFFLALKSSNPIIAGVNLMIAASTNALKFLTNGFKVSRDMSMRWKEAMSAMKLSTWVGWITAAAAAIYLVYSRTKTFTDKLKDLTKTTQDFDKEIVNEIKKLDELFGVLDACEKGTNEYEKAKDNIVKQYDRYLAGLIDEKGQIIDLEKAYNRLTIAVQRSAQARLLDKMKDNVEDIFIKELNDKINHLKGELETWGMPVRDIARVTTQIYMSAARGQEIPKDVINTINKYTNNLFGKNTNESFWGKLFNMVKPSFVANDWVMDLEDINDITKGYTNATMSLESAKEGLKQFGNLNDEMLEQQISHLQKGIDDYDTKVKHNNYVNASNGVGNKNLQQGTGVGSAMNLQQQQIQLGSVEFYEFGEKLGPGQSMRKSYITRDEAQKRIEEMKTELVLRKGGRSETGTAVMEDDDTDAFTYTTERERRKQETEAKRAEAEARRAKTKAKQEFKDALNETKKAWEERDTQNLVEYENGEKNWYDFMKTKKKSEMKYFYDREKVYKRFNLEEDEDYAELLKKKEEAAARWNDKFLSMSEEKADREREQALFELEVELQDMRSETFRDEEYKQKRIYEIDKEWIEKKKKLHNKGSEDEFKYKQQLRKLDQDEQLRQQKLLNDKLIQFSEQYRLQDADKRYKYEINILKALLKLGKIDAAQYTEIREDMERNYLDEHLPESAKRRTRDRELDELQKQKDLEQLERLRDFGNVSIDEVMAREERVIKYYRDKEIEEAKAQNSEEVNQILAVYEAWNAFFENTGEEGENWATKMANLAAGVFAVMKTGLTSISEYSKACADAEVAETEKKYDKQIEAAEGNDAKIKQLEEKKKAAIAKIKEEQSKKQFTMSVIEAVAQTSLNAINAYGAGLKVGGAAGLVIAPIAAAMAVAAGAIQIATLKKQQQAAAASGYAEGGFTPRGKKYDPVGVVHAGEWVAPASMVNDPTTRPMIDMLERARRGYRLGNVSNADVTRAYMRSLPSPTPTVTKEVIREVQTYSADNSALSESLQKLNKRLEAPIVAQTTVTGDAGYKRAEAEYNKIMRNKS